MRLDKVTIHNLGPFKHVELDLTNAPRLLALSAPNGSGKTVLCECAIPGACWRTTPTRGSLADLATGRDSYVEATIVNGMRFTVRHSVDGSTGKGETLLTDADGAPILGSSKVRDFDQWAKSHLPAQEVVLNSMFSPQGSGGFLELSAGDRKRVLLRTLGIERYEALAEQAREKARIASQRLDTVAARMADEIARGGDLDAAQANLDAAIAEAARADAAVAECRQRLTGADETIAALRAETARLASEMEAQEVGAKDAERAAAEANARREHALVAAEKVKADLGAKLRDARAKVDRTHAAIANNRKVLADREAIRAAVARAAELDAEIAEQRQCLTETRAKAGQWATTAQACEREARAATAKVRAADDRATKAQGVLRDRERVEQAVAELPALQAALDAAEAAVESAREVRNALGEKRAAGAEERIGALRGALITIREGGYLCDLERAPDVAASAIATDDAAVELAAKLPGEISAADMAVVGAQMSHQRAADALKAAGRLAALAPTIAAAQADFDAAEIESLAAQSEEQQATLDADAARKSERNALTSANGIEAAIRAMEAERASLATQVQFTDRLATAEARIQELEGFLAEQVASAREIEVEIEALPIEPAEAVQAGKEAAVALERAKAARSNLDALMGEARAVEAKRFETVQEQLRGRAALDLAEVKARTARAAVTLAEGKVELARSSAGTLNTLKAERGTIEAALEDWNLLAESLGPKGIQAMEIDVAGGEISTIANALLHAAFGPRFTIQFDTTRPSSDGKKSVECFDVKVIDTVRGREGGAETFSGGERVILSEALSLALSTVACRQAGLEHPTIVRDESGAALDQENSRAYVAMVRKSADLVSAGTVILVSHNPEVQDLCDAKILIEGGTVRVEL